MMVLPRTRLIGLVLLFLLGTSRFVRSEDSTATTANAAASKLPVTVRPERNVMADLKVIIRDTDEKPIVGATIFPYALRVKEQEGHGFWDREKFGAPKSVTTDQNGVGVIRYPAKFEVGSDLCTTILVTFLVKHSDFVQKVVHFNLGLPEAEVTLEPGCEVQFSAVDEKGNPVTSFAVMMSGPFATDQWVSDGQNGRRTRAIKDGQWQTLLVSIPEQGPVLFSGVLPFNARPKQAVKLRNIRLSPGAHLKGTLAANVPRPVKNGRVIATAVPRPAGPGYDEKDPSLTWHECTEIDEQGHFEFLSLPRGGQVQIIAICDGWLSKTDIEEARNVFVMGKLYPLEERDVSIDVEMEQTGVLEVTVKKPDGTPLEGAGVATWPNMLYYKGGSTILGSEFHSRDQVAVQLNLGSRKTQISRPDIPKNLSQKTDKAGKVVLSGIPIGRSESLAIEHSKFQLPMDRDQRRTTHYKIDSEIPQKLELTLQEIKTEAPSDKP